MHLGGEEGALHWKGLRALSEEKLPGRPPNTVTRCQLLCLPFFHHCLPIATSASGYKALYPSVTGRLDNPYPIKETEPDHQYLSLLGLC